MVWAEYNVLHPIGGPVLRLTWTFRRLGGDFISKFGDTVGYGKS